MRVLPVIISLLLITSVSAQAPSPPSRDNGIYLGMGYGAVGIVDALLDYVSTNQDNKIETVINSTVTKLLKVSSNLNWHKTTEDKTLWTGYKYGQEGLQKLFLRLYQRYGISNFLQISEKLLNDRIIQYNNQVNKTFWGYEYINTSTALGISLTGLDFGASSVISNALDLYQITGNSSYLGIAESAASWMIGLRNATAPDPLNLAIPWFEVEGFKPVYITSHARGMAGMIPQFSRLYSITQNQTYRNIQTDLVNYLLASQLEDGSWTLDSNTDTVYLNLDEGVAGVILSLDRYARSIDGVNESITKAIGYIENNILTIDSFQYSTGLPGILEVFKKMNYNSDRVEVAERMFLNNFKVANDGKEKFIVYESDIKDGVYDLSLKNGLAGAFRVLLKLQPNSPLISGILSTYNLFNEDGLWRRQIELPASYFTSDDSPNLLLYASIVMILALIALVILKIKSN